MNLSIQTMTKDQSRDTGMAMVLLLLLIYLKTRREGWLYSAMVLHVVNMIRPADICTRCRSLVGTLPYPRHRDVKGPPFDFIFCRGHTDRSATAAFWEGFFKIA